jgi:hypothetical protein
MVLKIIKIYSPPMVNLPNYNMITTTTACIRHEKDMKRKVTEIPWSMNLEVHNVY